MITVLKVWTKPIKIQRTYSSAVFTHWAYFLVLAQCQMPAKFQEGCPKSSPQQAVCPLPLVHNFDLFSCFYSCPLGSHSDSYSMQSDFCLHLAYFADQDCGRFCLFPLKNIFYSYYSFGVGCLIDWLFLPLFSLWARVSLWGPHWLRHCHPLVLVSDITTVLDLHIITLIAS